MIKISNEEKSSIIKMHLEGKTVEEIYFDNTVKFQKPTIDKIISEYYRLSGKQRPRETPKKSANQQKTKEEIKELLKKQLKQGRPKEEINRIAKKYGIDLKEDNYER